MATSTIFLGLVVLVSVIGQAAIIVWLNSRATDRAESVAKRKAELIDKSFESSL